MLKADVFDRTGINEMTRNAFYFAVGAILVWGFVATYIVSQVTAQWKPTIMGILIVGLGFPIIGIFMSAKGGAFVSFIGFNMVAIPFGAILGPALAMYEVAQPGLVSEAAQLTAIVAGLMALSGIMFPNFYRSIGGFLFGALSALLVVVILSLFIPALEKFSLIHYSAAGIFALYIGYDMYRASEIPATLDNAVDVCVSLYLDIINLFLWILRIMGNKSGD